MNPIERKATDKLLDRYSSPAVIRGRGRVENSSSYSCPPNATRPLITDRLHVGGGQSTTSRRRLALGMKGAAVVSSTAALFATVIAGPDWAIWLAILGWAAVCTLCAADD